MLRFRAAILIFGDIILAYIALFAALYIKYGVVFSQERFEAHLWQFSIVYFIWFFIFFIYGLFNITQIIKFIDLLRNFILAAITAGGLSTVYFYIQTPFVIISPKTFLLIDAGIFFILSLLWHRFFLFDIWMGKLKKRIIVVGLNKISQEIFYEIKSRPGLGYEILAFVDSDNSRQAEKINPANPVRSSAGFSLKSQFNSADDFVSIQNKTNNLFEASNGVNIITINDFKNIILRGVKIDLVIVAIDLLSEKYILDELFSILSLRKIEFINALSLYEQLTGKVFLDPIGKLWFLENIHHAGWYNLRKKIMDLIFGFLVGFIFVVTMPLIALAIKAGSRGPVFYKQKRVGLRHKSFILYKFRTMVNNAEGDGPVLTEQNDRRITTVGRILRKLRLDEMPQVMNIIKGEMSLVGPRPERPEWIERFEGEIPFHRERSLVRPGLTGWAQVNWQYASTIETMRTRLQYDLFYIKNRSLFLDCEIILKTIRIIISGKGR